jgi:hypothetical protein
LDLPPSSPDRPPSLLGRPSLWPSSLCDERHHDHHFSLERFHDGYQTFGICHDYPSLQFQSHQSTQTNESHPTSDTIVTRYSDHRQGLDW